MFAGPISLSAFNRLVKDVLDEAFPEKYWVTAEIAECKTNASGHCYLELIEKKAGSDRLLARAKAVIWSNVWFFLSSRFQMSTGTPLSRGQKVLVEVSVSYHECYGLSLVITDIDPNYTLGDWARRRQEILQRLKEEGVLDLNKEVSWPLLPQRLAIISSATAAGYEDFCVQLKESGFAFEWTLFPAVMQGDQAEASILQALDAIMEESDRFDVVVMIRGGGATADLSCFDSYALCASIAQFPLPVLTGIGHERDESVADLVAYRALKTPTAVAEFLRESMSGQWEQLQEYQQSLRQYVQQLLQEGRQRLQRYADALRISTSQAVYRQQLYLQRQWMLLSQCTEKRLQEQRHRLEMMQSQLKLYSPQDQLDRGYSLSLVDGKIVKSVEQLKPGCILETRLRDGVAFSRLASVQVACKQEDKKNT